MARFQLDSQFPVVRPEPLSCIKKSPSPALLHVRFLATTAHCQSTAFPVGASFLTSLPGSRTSPFLLPLATGVRPPLRWCFFQTKPIGWSANAPLQNTTDFTYQIANLLPPPSLETWTLFAPRTLHYSLSSTFITQITSKFFQICWSVTGVLSSGGPFHYQNNASVLASRARQRAYPQPPRAFLFFFPLLPPSSEQSGQWKLCCPKEAAQSYMQLFHEPGGTCSHPIS